jgi:hypothetical protein
MRRFHVWCHRRPRRPLTVTKLATLSSVKYSLCERGLPFSSLRSFSDFTQFLNRCLSNMRVKNAAGTNGKIQYVHLALLTHTMVFCDEWSGKVSRGGPRLLGSLIWTRQARSRFLARVLGRDGNARITQACATRDVRRCDGGAVSRRCARHWPSAISYALLRAAYSENSQCRRRLLSTEPGYHLERAWSDGVAWPAGPSRHAGTGGTDRSQG